MADRKRTASTEAEGSSRSRRRVSIYNLIPSANPSPGSDSESSSRGSRSRSPSPHDPNRFSGAENQLRRERDAARDELGEATKRFGIAEAEWEDQRKQFCDAITNLSEELNRVKAAATRVADKVNAQGETVEERLDAVDGRIDQVANYGLTLGAGLGMAWCSARTQHDFSVHPVLFPGGQHPHEVEGIDETLMRYDTHAVALAEATNPQSVLNRLFHDDD